MTIEVAFERSDACAEAHNLEAGARRTIELDSSDGPWLQLTYNTIRTQDGRMVAYLDEKDGCWFWADEAWSDVIVNFRGDN